MIANIFKKMWYSLITIMLLVTLGAFPKTVDAATDCESAGYVCQSTPCGAGFVPKPNVCGSEPYCCAPVGPKYVATCEELTRTTLDKAPSPLAILCPLVRFLNVLLLASAAVFVMYVFLSAIKFAMSQGDPKALQGAKGSLTWAVIGFIVIIGVFAMLVIIKNVLGLKDNPILDPIGALNDNLIKLLDNFGITGY